jgi:hypothetical protein
MHPSSSVDSAIESLTGALVLQQSKEADSWMIQLVAIWYGIKLAVSFLFFFFFRCRAAASRSEAASCARALPNEEP